MIMQYMEIIFSFNKMIDDINLIKLEYNTNNLAKK